MTAAYYVVRWGAAYLMGFHIGPDGKVPLWGTRDQAYPYPWRAETRRMCRRARKAKGLPRGAVVVTAVPVHMVRAA